MVLDFEGLRFAEPIDKLDSGIEKTNGVDALAIPLEAEFGNRDFLQGLTLVGFGALEPRV